MRFSIFLLAGASLASALPSIPSLFTRQDACSGNKADAGYCTPLTYNDVTTSSTSITTSNCQSTCASILADAGDWGVDFRGQPAGYIDGMFLSGCKFGIARETDSDTSQFSFDVANQDIVDVIDESIKRFGSSHGGKLSAEGTMTCQGHTVRWFVGY